MKILLSFLLFASLISNPLRANPLGQVSPEQLLALQQQQHALVIDIRTPAEWQASGIIAGSYKLQAFDDAGHFDQAKWLADLQKLKNSADQPVILVCRSGNRSSKLGSILTEQLGMSRVYHLSSGIQSWFNSGRPLAANCLMPTCQ